MALEYFFQISTKIEREVLEEYLQKFTFSREVLNETTVLYCSNHLGYIIYFSHFSGKEMNYYENGTDEYFFSPDICTKLTIRLDKFYDRNQVNLEIYDLVLFLINKYQNDCILRYLDSSMIFVRTNGIFIRGEEAKYTPFKDIE